MSNILVCDDEKDIVVALKIYLSSDGHTVFEAYNGRQAIDIIHKNNIDLALLDVMMPVTDGITAVAEIRIFVALLGRIFHGYDPFSLQTDFRA